MIFSSDDPLANIVPSLLNAIDSTELLCLFNVIIYSYF